MPEESPLSPALERLNKAIETLEKKIAVRMEREAELGDAEAEVQRMGADRTRLAESLDVAQERSQQLEHVNKEVSRRLVDSMEVIRNVIERQKPSEG